MEIIALDAHKRYSQVCIQKQNGQILCEKRINHGKGQIGDFLSKWTSGSSVALETVGNWYWLIISVFHSGIPVNYIGGSEKKRTRQSGGCGWQTPG